MLLARGTHPEVVSEMVGHAIITLALDTYSYLVATLHTAAATTMVAVLGIGKPGCGQRWGQPRSEDRPNGRSSSISAPDKEFWGCRRWESNPHALAGSGF